MVNNILSNDSGKVFSKKLIIVFLVFILFSGFIWLRYSNRVRIETAAYGELVISNKSSGLIIRDEKVFYSPYQGEVDLLKSGGERVSYGEEILSINSENKEIAIHAKNNGVISFAVDGWESTLTPENINKFDVERKKEISSNYSHLISGNEVEEEDPLYRIVDNKNIYLYLFISNEWGERISEGDEVVIQPQGSEKQFNARIKKNIKHESENIAYVKINRFPDSWLNIRTVDIKMIKDVHEGILIPREAIYNTPQGRGVLKFSDGEQYNFTEITVEATGQDYAVVRGVNIGEQIVVNPQATNYGGRQ